MRTNLLSSTDAKIETSTVVLSTATDLVGFPS